MPFFHIERSYFRIFNISSIQLQLEREYVLITPVAGKIDRSTRRLSTAMERMSERE